MIMCTHKHTHDYVTRVCIHMITHIMHICTHMYVFMINIFMTQLSINKS